MGWRLQTKANLSDAQWSDISSSATTNRMRLTVHVWFQALGYEMMAG
jgi:hypothetical protein